MPNSIGRRWRAVRTCRNNEKLQKIENVRCKRDVVYWFNNWVWTYDPRLAETGRATIIPMDLFPRQEALLRWFDERLAFREDGLLEKSRDIGATWLFAGWSVHKWLYVPGFKIAVGSRKAELVDKLGDPDSIFEKIRILIRHLPTWMKPPQFVESFHDNHMRLINPDSDAMIRGEAGDDMGRGGRSTVMFVDEAAHIQNAESVDAASLANTNVRIWVSSVDGMGNLFARKRHDGSMKPRQIFNFHYRDDPRMTPDRVESLRGKVDDWKWNAEYEIDYSASVEGICIPAKWVTAAQELEGMLRDAGHKIEPAMRGISGVDVGGGGKAKSVHVARFGPIIRLPLSIGKADTDEVAEWALALAGAERMKRSDGRDAVVTLLNYDSVGVGAGVMATMKRKAKGLTAQGVNVGMPPSDRRWPDGETSVEKFPNLKAELWFLARTRFWKSYQVWLFLRGETGGQLHPVDELILLPPSSAGPDAMTLASQLSLPKIVKTETGKLSMETKKMLAKRGIASPDHAEALILTMEERSAVATFLAAFDRPRVPSPRNQRPKQ